MARPYRKEKVASLIREIVSETIAHRMNDPRLVPLTTVTRVEVTSDLSLARVYLCVPGGETAERKSLSAVQHAGGFIQRSVAGGLGIRQCPELRFSLDDQIKRVQATLSLIEKNKREVSLRLNPEGTAGKEADAVESTDREDESDDPREVIS